MQVTPTEETLARLTDCTVSAPTGAWEPSFASLVLATSAAGRASPSDAVREGAVALLGELAARHPALFLRSGSHGASALDIVVPNLLATASSDSSKEVRWTG